MNYDDLVGALVLCKRYLEDYGEGELAGRVMAVVRETLTGLDQDGTHERHADTWLVEEVAELEEGVLLSTTTR